MNARSVVSLLFLFLSLSSRLCAQAFLGSFYFYNYSRFEGIDAPIFNVDGTRLYGADYLAELYGGPTPDSLQEAMTGTLGGYYENAPLRVPVTHVTSGGLRGYFRASTYVVIPDVYAGTTAYLQVRVWDSRLGGTYEEVAARGMGGYGASAIFSQIAPGSSTGPPLPDSLFRLQSFSLVPEPGMLGLAVGGGLGLFMALKRSRAVKT